MFVVYLTIDLALSNKMIGGVTYQKGYGRKQSWHSLSYYLDIWL